MLFSVKMMAILHLSDEKGTEKRDLKIAAVLSVRGGWGGGGGNWQPESPCLAGRGQPVPLRGSGAPW